MNNEQLEELILQSLEHERGGLAIYSAALGCVTNDELKAEWEHYREQTQSHIAALERICAKLAVDAERETPGRAVVRHLGKALVQAIELGRAAGPAAAELTACECIVLAETKDHFDWSLLGSCGEHLDGPEAEVLRSEYQVIEDQEDEHVYHTKGWCRELWARALGMNAMLPPPEDIRRVKTAVGAAKAQQLAEKTR